MWRGTQVSVMALDNVATEDDKYHKTKNYKVDRHDLLTLEVAVSTQLLSNQHMVFFYQKFSEKFVNPTSKYSAHDGNKPRSNKVKLLRNYYVLTYYYVNTYCYVIS